jgi:hypothetical protein
VILRVRRLERQQKADDQRRAQPANRSRPTGDDSGPVFLPYQHGSIDSNSLASRTDRCSLWVEAV